MKRPKPDFSAKRCLHLLVSGLGGGRDDWSRQVPALAALLARGHRRDALASLSRLIAQAFGLDGAIAAHALAGEGRDPGTEVWLRADPVSLRFYQDRLILLDPRLLSLRHEEAEALVQTLNRHFAADGLVIHAPRPESWYIRLPAGLSPPNSEPPDALIGRPLDAHLPSGVAAAFWRRRLNETQMLLHDHPVNQARESQGLPPINSLWFWGAGRRTHPLKGVFRHVVADHPLAHALAAAAGSECLALDRLPALEHLRAAMVVVELPAGVDTKRRLDLLRAYEARLFRPALRGLKRGRWQTMTVACAAPLSIARRLTPLDAWCLWRRLDQRRFYASAHE